MIAVVKAVPDAQGASLPARISSIERIRPSIRAHISTGIENSQLDVSNVILHAVY